MHYNYQMELYPNNIKIKVIENVFMFFLPTQWVENNNKNFIYQLIYRLFELM